MHFLVKQSLARLKAALASGTSRGPLSFVALSPRDLETLQRATRGEGLEGIKFPADRREVCIQRRAAGELIEQIEGRFAPPAGPAEPDLPEKGGDG